jgi:hypothetical protein
MMTKPVNPGIKNQQSGMNQLSGINSIMLSCIIIQAAKFTTTPLCTAQATHQKQASGGYQYG